MERKTLFCHPFNKLASLSVDYFKFGETSFDVLHDFLVDLNNKNTENMQNLSKYCGSFKNPRLIEFVFFICEEFRVDPTAGYQAVELLERFMIKRIEDLLGLEIQDGEAENSNSPKNLALMKLKKKFPLLAFSCVQLASKLVQHQNVIDNNRGVKFLQSLGHSCSKETLLQHELLILKTLEFCLSTPNPLTFVETMLEALGQHEFIYKLDVAPMLGYNGVPVSIPHLYAVCQRVLQFVYLKRSTIYHSLLVATTECVSPCQEQRVKFRSVMEDYMLLSVGVIAAGAFILDFASLEKVVEELKHITGISAQSIMDFVRATLVCILGRDTALHSSS